MHLRVGRNQDRQYFRPPSSVKLLGSDTFTKHHANLHSLHSPSEPSSTFHPLLAVFFCSLSDPLTLRQSHVDLVEAPKEASTIPSRLQDLNS